MIENARLTYSMLRDLVTDEEVAGISIVRRLQPLAGRGTPVAPPSYAKTKGAADNEGQRHNIHYIPHPADASRRVQAAVLDSTASQANRIEIELLRAVERENFPFPLHRVRVDGYGDITDLELPHRVFDKTITSASAPPPDSRKWKQLPSSIEIEKADQRCADAILKHAPAVLIFGGWNSHGKKSTAFRQRFHKSVCSMIRAVNVEVQERTGGRIDPLHLPSKEPATLDEKRTDLSKHGLGTVPSSLTADLGARGKNSGRPLLLVTMEYAEQVSAIHFGVYRDLGFNDSKTDDVARTWLAATAVYAMSLHHARGGRLRSECDLVLEDENAASWRVRRRDGRDETLAPPAPKEARAIADEAREEAVRAGASMGREDVHLKLHPELAEIRQRKGEERSIGAGGDE